MCSTPVLPEVNALFNHLLEFHHSRQQRAKDTCVRQSAHTCTALLCIRRTVEAIVAQIQRVAAPAAAQPSATPDQAQELQILRHSLALMQVELARIRLELEAEKQLKADKLEAEKVKVPHTHTSDT